MDTIDRRVMHDAGEVVAGVIRMNELAIVCTVTVTLNGAHGGADVIMEGFTSEDDIITVTKEVPW